MKKIISITALMVFIFSVVSCNTVKYAKNENLAENKLPFEQSDYPSSDTEYFTIQNVKGSNMSLLRTRALSLAKTILSGQIKGKVLNIAVTELSFNDGEERESAEQRIEEASALSIAKVQLVDSKLFSDKEGEKDTYDYWTVYRIIIDDVVDIINKSDLGFTVNPSDFSDIQ
tara:strand:- start:965 stop:1480 length:516 start_codon:yes stop_codon:yes gene_type:complete